MTLDSNCVREIDNSIFVVIALLYNKDFVSCVIKQTCLQECFNDINGLACPARLYPICARSEALASLGPSDAWQADRSV